MFIELTDYQSNARLSININHITEVFNAGNKTYIWTLDSRQSVVKEWYAEVLELINKKAVSGN